MKSINIWKRITNRKITVYRCFQTIPDNKFFVQSQDYYYMDEQTGIINKEQIDFLQNQFLERIFDVDRVDNTYFDSLEEALDAFNEPLD